MSQQAIGRILLMPKGVYNSATVYNSLDWVRYDSKSWVCKLDNTVGVTPAEGTNWTLMAADGSVSGSVAWSAVTGKPFVSVDSSDFQVDGSDELNIKRNTFGKIRIKSGGSTTDLSASGDSTFEIDAGTNVTIAADNTTNPKKITINSSGGGGGSSTFSGLSDVSVSSMTSGQIVRYRTVGGSLKLCNENMPQGGHDMVANTPESTLLTSISGATTSNDKVVSAYGIKTWSNCEAKSIMATASKDSDGIGTWEDDDVWESSSVRTGWIWSAELYRVLEDANGNRNLDVEIIPIFDVGDSETISLYAYRIDDNYSYGGVNGGCVAFKFNGKVKTSGGVTVGVKLVYQRTERASATILPSS